MKSLQTIQKTFQVFQVLTKIAMILSYVWAGLAALGILCGAVWYRGGTVVGASRELLYSLTETGGLLEMIGVLLTHVILALTDGTLLVFALRYFTAAEQVREVGILSIVLPLVAAILVATVCKIFDLPLNVCGDWSNLSGVTMGIVLILASLVFRYGAELTEFEDRTNPERGTL